MIYKIGDYVYARFCRGNLNINPQDEWGEFFMVLNCEKVGQDLVLDLQGFYYDKVFTVTLGKDIEYLQKFPFQAKDEIFNENTKIQFILTGIKYRKISLQGLIDPDYIDRHFFLQSANNKTTKVNFEQLLKEYTAL